jgi:hypothetical protein
MSRKGGAGSTYSCATLRYLVDPGREITIPAGVILWSQPENRLWFRLPREGEALDGVPAAQARAYLEIIREKIEGWRRLGELPYQTAPLLPLSAAWWEEVRRLLQWRVRLGPIQPLVCHNPEAELEGLYEALVQPLAPVPEPTGPSELVPAVPALD